MEIQFDISQSIKGKIFVENLKKKELDKRALIILFTWLSSSNIFHSLSFDDLDGMCDIFQKDEFSAQ